MILFPLVSYFILNKLSYIFIYSLFNDTLAVAQTILLPNERIMLNNKLERL